MVFFTTYRPSWDDVSKLPSLCFSGSANLENHWNSSIEDNFQGSVSTLLGITRVADFGAHCWETASMRIAQEILIGLWPDPYSTNGKLVVWVGGLAVYYNQSPNF